MIPLEAKKLYRKRSTLVYAESKCPCGAPLAYRAKSDPIQGSWDCSAILDGTAIEKGQPGAVKHTDKLPFVFWKVKSRKS